MLISNEEASKRLNSPMNLINSMRNGSRSKAMSLFVPSFPSPQKVEEVKKIEEKILEPKKEESSVTFNPFHKLEIPTPSLPNLPIKAEPSVNDLLTNSDAQIRLGLAHDQALEVLTDSILTLKAKLPEIKADKLPQVITATSKVVESIRRERNEAAKIGKDREVHYHFYTPERKVISDYAVIDVTP